jgi:hypothetical protein
MKDDKILVEYLPENSVKQVMKWIVQKKVHLKITRGRKSKLGDYRPPIRYSNHRISINHDLNQYAFLITFVHEMAHLNVWEVHQNRVAPHGVEWKNEYRKLMKVVLKNNIFPDDIHEVLSQSIINSKASSSSELQLTRVLKKYDSNSFGISLEDIPENTIFQTESGSQFKKGEKRRTRYVCLNMQNNKHYLFHPLCSVVELKN